MSTEAPPVGDADSARPGPVPLWFGRLVEPLYAAAISRRNAQFDAGRGVTRLEVPVISVGNLTVGGTGKTPMVMHIVGVLLRAGRSPCIAMRGYRGSKLGGSDEADMYRRALPRVPVVAQTDRIAGIQNVMQAVDPTRAPIDCVVLDDGFQHRRIARDLDIVLVDASRPIERDRLLPAGWLREPVRNLKRASAVVITHAEQVNPAGLSSLESSIEREHGQRPIAITRHMWTGVVQGEGDQPRRPLDALLGRRVIACCAIGNPDAFLRSLENNCPFDGKNGVVGRLILPDHDAFASETLERLIALAKSQRADAIVVTDKDWSKLRRVPQERWPCPVLRPVLELSFDRGAGEFEARVLAAASPRT
jgi:tetraacyldisaccharide 4'-kinase